ncbi:MAG TPA: hypothetical protein PLY73_16710, partial [Candidatus Ozemobacteraceae bacterium]|nr:hypothetical protein [Candidatus Ozemobacteraceae bacterium]
LASLLKSAIKTQTGSRLRYESLKINGSEGTGTLSNAALENASSVAFLTIREAGIRLASGTSVLSVLAGDAPVHLFEARDIDVDLDHLKLPERKLQTGEYPGTMPINRFIARNIRVHTVVGTFTIDALELDARRVAGEYAGQLGVARNPLGGVASVSFRIPFDLGTGSVAIDWNDVDIPRLTALYPVLWLWGIAVESGSATVSLRWTGNLRERLEKLDARLDALFRNELKGRLRVSDLAVTRDRLTTKWNGTIQTAPNAHGTWNCRLDGGHARDSILVESVIDGSGPGWGIGASGTADVSTDTWSLIEAFAPVTAAVEPGAARLRFNVRRPHGKPWQGDVAGRLDGFLSKACRSKRPVSLSEPKAGKYDIPQRCAPRRADATPKARMIPTRVSGMPISRSPPSEAIEFNIFLKNSKEFSPEPFMCREIPLGSRMHA